MSTAETLILLVKVIAWIVFIVGGYHLIVQRIMKNFHKAQIELGEKEMEKFGQERTKRNLNETYTLAKEFYKLAISLGSPGYGEKTAEQQNYWDKYHNLIRSLGKLIVITIVREDTCHRFKYLNQYPNFIDGKIYIISEYSVNINDNLVLIDFAIKQMIEDKKSLIEIIDYCKSTINTNGLTIMPDPNEAKLTNYSTP
jgi:hypothetical protein